MADCRQIDVLERRIESLEALVFGDADKDTLYPKDSSLSNQCVENLVNVQNKITAATAGRKKIPKAYDKVPMLRNYLDQAATDEMTLPDDTKAEIILAEEDFIRQQASLLEGIQKLDEILDSEHIKAAPKLSNKLQQLCQIQIKQQDEASEFSDEVRGLMDSYNAIITLLSKQFVQWDETITNLEISAKPKKSLD